MSNTATLPTTGTDNPSSTPASQFLDTTNRCDRCGAQAYIKATNPETGHSLLFCGHHGNKKAGTQSVKATLKEKGWVIDDQTSRLTENGTRPDGGSAAG